VLPLEKLTPKNKKPNNNQQITAATTSAKDLQQTDFRV
jgi:hypothetical protein